VINFPERDDQEFEDMGRGKRTIDFSAYVIGENYLADREKLIKDLEAAGTGKLIHPYRGNLRARCLTWTATDSRSNGGFCRFEISMVRDDEAEVVFKRDTQADVFSRKATAYEKVTEWFEKAYDVSREPITRVEQSRDAIGKVNDILVAAKTVTGSVPEFARATREVDGALDTLVLNAQAIAQDLGQITDFGTDFKDPRLFVVSEENAVEQSFEMRRAQDLNAEADPDDGSPASIIFKMSIIQVILSEAGLYTVVPFGSPEIADEIERDLVQRIDNILDAIEPTDDLFNAIQDLKTSLHDNLEERSINLPKVAIIRIDGITNALELNNEKYGNLNLLDDFLRRNQIIHPGFVPSNKALSLQVTENE
jgi:prophage DNA circulation protein